MINIEYISDGIKISSDENEILIDWKTIEYKMLEQTLSDRVLVEFNYSYGRDFFKDTYVLKKDYWNKLKKKLLNKDIWLGEVCGKHSDVWCNFSDEDIVEKNNINDVIDFVKLYGYERTDHCVLDNFYEQHNNEE